MELPNQEFFSYKDVNFCNDECWLITPKCSDGKGVWTKDNLRFRSVVIRKADKYVCSQLYPKFLNYGQSPGLYPDPTKFNDWIIYDKLDGSLCGVTKHNGIINARSRGTINSFELDTASELRELFDKYPNIEKSSHLDEYTLLFEHISVMRPIVIKYPKPDLILLDIIHKQTAEYLPHSVTDIVAKELGVLRPKRFDFATIQQISELCRTLVGVEGFVLNYGNGHKVKLKTDDYCVKHRIKSLFAREKDIFEFWFENGRLPKDEFLTKVEKEVDFETARDISNTVDKIIVISRELDNKISAIKEFVKTLPSIRKEAALLIKGRWGNYAGLAFQILDCGEVDDRIIKKRLEELLFEK